MHCYLHNLVRTAMEEAGAESEGMGGDMDGGVGKRLT